MNASFTQITSNGEDLGWPATKAKDLNGLALTLDADGDSSLDVSVDDVATLTLQGFAAFIFDGDVASPVNGITFTSSATGVTPVLAAQGEANSGIKLAANGTGDVEIGAGTGETDILVTAEGSVADVALRVIGKGTGKVELGDGFLAWPDTDGSANQALITDGAGALSFGAAPLITGDRMTFQQETPSALFSKDFGMQDDTAFRFTTGVAGSDLTGNTFTVNFASRASGNVSANHDHNAAGTLVNSSFTSLDIAGDTGLNVDAIGTTSHTHTISGTTGNQNANHTHTTDMTVDYYDLVVGEVT